jgi:DNA-binding NarL/FixJ family response regulator
MPTAGNARLFTSSPRTVLWLLANALDCEALAMWCHSRILCDGVETVADLDDGLRRCEHWRPRLLVLDPAVHNDAIARTLAALRCSLARHLLILDRRPREGRLVEILNEPAASYLTRTAGPHALAEAISGILQHGRRVIDPALADRVRATEQGLVLDASPGGSVAGLSLREREVMRLLAQGKTVRECAATLGLAHSTIENHKQRLMRKLGIHKTSELTCRAVRDGLIAL